VLRSLVRRSAMGSVKALMDGNLDVEYWLFGSI